MQDGTAPRELLMYAADLAVEYLADLDRRPVAPSADVEALRSRLDCQLPDAPQPAEAVLQRLAAGVDGGLVASGGPRYFGFVVGGATPVSVAADWLTSAWDQNGHVFATSPAVAVVEETVAGWLLDLLHLPADSSVGFVTGGQMANFTALTVARNAVLGRAGWDVAADGLAGAPSLRVFASEQVHATVRDALYLAGVGARSIVAVPADPQGRMVAAELASLLAGHEGPAIISAQAGNVNTGAFEDFGALARIARAHDAWLHVDGAFGLWAAASARYRHLLAGAELADSWGIDAHKWLNVPYDSGLVIVRDAEAHRRLKQGRCAYAGSAAEDRRDGSVLAPENSRRARGFVLYAALAALGRSGVERLVDHCCAAAVRFAESAGRLPHCRVLNEVVLNQVLLRFDPPGMADAVTYHERLAGMVRDSGVAWIGATQWRGSAALRVSVSNWATTSEDVERTVAVLAESAALVSASRSRRSPGGAGSPRR